MKRFFRRFLRFRWKLALSGMVATAAMMIVVSGAFMAFYTAKQRRSLLAEDVPQRVVESFARYTHELRPTMLADRPDAAALEGWMASRLRWGTTWLHLIGPDENCADCGERVKMPVLILADSGGRVIASQAEGPAAGSDLRSHVTEQGRQALDQVSVEQPETIQRDEQGDSYTVVGFYTLSGELRGLAFAKVDSAPPTIAEAFAHFFGMIPRGLLEIAPFALILGTIFSVMTSRGLLRRLRNLGNASAAWSRGDFKVRVRDSTADELGELGRDLDDMADQLGELMETRQELAALEERNHLARELHDTVKQEIFSISMLLGTVETLFESDREQAGKLLAEARQLSGQAGRELNALILHLRPASLDGKGLATALREYCEDWSNKLGIVSQVRVQGERQLPLELEQGLFRVAQEALANVAWHSGSEGVEVRLAILEADGNGSSRPRMTLSVEDKGDGFDVEGADKRGFGLRGMRERMEQLGGHLEVRTHPGLGTRIVAECPIG